MHKYACCINIKLTVYVGSVFWGASIFCNYVLKFFGHVYK